MVRKIVMETTPQWIVVIQDSTDSNATQVAANVSPGEAVTVDKGKKPARGRTTRGRITRVTQGRKKQKEDDAAVRWKKTDVDAMMTNLQKDAKKREDDLRKQANSWKKELDKAYKAIDDTEERMNLTARQREVQIFEDAQRREDALKKDARDKEETLKKELKDKDAKFFALIQQRDDVARKEAQDREEEWKMKFAAFQDTTTKLLDQANKRTVQTSVIPDRGSAVAGDASQQASVIRPDPTRTLRANQGVPAFAAVAENKDKSDNRTTRSGTSYNKTTLVSQKDKEAPQHSTTTGTRGTTDHVTGEYSNPVIGQRTVNVGPPPPSYSSTLGTKITDVLKTFTKKTVPSTSIDFQMPRANLSTDNVTVSNASRCDIDAMNSMIGGRAEDESMHRPGQTSVGLKPGVTPGAQRRVLPTIVNNEVRDREREDIRNERDATRGIEEELRAVHLGGQDTSMDHAFAMHLQRQYEEEAENMCKRLMEEKEKSEAQLKAQLLQTLNEERVNLHTQVNEMMNAANALMNKTKQLFVIHPNRYL